MGICVREDRATKTIELSGQRRGTGKTGIGAGTFTANAIHTEKAEGTVVVVRADARGARRSRRVNLADSSPIAEAIFIAEKRTVISTLIIRVCSSNDWFTNPIGSVSFF